MSGAGEAVSLPGPRKAAVLCVLLGEEVGAKIFRHLPPEHIRLVASEVARLGPVEPDLARRVLEEFFVEAVRPKAEAGGRDYARRLLDQAGLPEQVKAELLGPARDPLAGQLGPLLDVADDALGGILADEHPQTRALLLLCLPPPRAARLLGRLPEHARTETLLRMARMRRVRAEVVADVASCLRERLGGEAAADWDAGPSGIERAAGVLSSLDRAEARRLLEAVAAEDAEKAEQLRGLVFTFESLAEADDRGMQELLRAVETKVLALALHGAAEAVAAKVFRNLSERAASMLRDEMEFLGVVRPEDRAAARKEILAQALRLEEEGRLAFVGGAAEGGRSA